MSLRIEDNALVLFQGDSITDAGRRRRKGADLGGGYVARIGAVLSALYPDRGISLLNRGLSGNRVCDLVSRWEADCIALAPTWVSIMIGVNDTWRRYDRGDATSTEAFEAAYRDILTRTRRRLDARIVVVEPFLLPHPPDRLAWREDLDPKIQAVRALAQEFADFYVPMDGVFARAAAEKDPAFWAADGVHPTAEGHALIARAWLRAVGVLA